MLDLGLLSRSRIRLIRQTEIAECGLACLAMVAGYHGLHTDLGILRRRFAPSLRGVELSSLMATADALGLMPRAVQLPLEELKNLDLPAVLHWDMNHFVVIEAVRGGRVLIHDPKGVSTLMPMAEVSKHFTGIALELRPGTNFETGTQRERLSLSHIWKRMVGFKRALLQVLILSIVLQFFALAIPYYMQIAIDNVLPAQDYDLLWILALGFGLLTAINALATLLRAFILMVAGTSLGFNLSANIARRLFRLPIEWFEKRHTGDVLSRFQSIAPIQTLLTQGTVGSLIDGVTAVLILSMMFYYNAALACVSLVAFILYLLVRLISFTIERDAQEGKIVSRSREQTMLIETLRGMTTLRLFGRETIRHALWQTHLTEAVNAEARVARISIWQMSTNALIFGLENIVTIWLAVHLVIDSSGFSLGMLFAFISYKMQFMQKAVALIDQGIAFRMLGLHLERLTDIAMATEDRSLLSGFDRHTELKGRIEFKNIHYRYGPSETLILKDVSFVVEPGEHLAITGPSGGGKSTLAKILLGLALPESGEVIVDGIPLDKFGLRSYHEQIAAVLQEDSLFSGSIADNIALFDEKVDMDRVIEAAKAAAIHNDIMNMTMEYETLLGDMGSTISGGQKQRIFLARALYRKPRLLLMDEGTAHLDAMHERAVSAAISEMGITRIIIAHRKETIAAADRVLVIRDGQLSHEVDEANSNDLPVVK